MPDRRRLPNQGRQITRVLAALTYGALTSVEVSQRTGISVRLCSAWLSKLGRRRIVDRTLERRQGKRGRPAVVWVQRFSL